MADINVEITNADIAQWFGEIHLVAKRQEKAIAVLSAKLDELTLKLEPKSKVESIP